ncbi:hypothetical protein BGX26_009392 [Mortierella sp. AD094]|nr:hypothetical protein BGX26_009392 [Mortierella sp. AD094]
MKITRFFSATLVVASVLLVSNTEAMRCKCVINALSNYATEGIACCNSIGRTSLYNVLRQFLGCDIPQGNIDNNKFNACCNNYVLTDGSGRHLYGGCSVL